MPTRVPAKKQVLLALLEQGVAMVHLDARRPGVVVPPQYAGDAHLRLNLSYRYRIPDLQITDQHVQATLSFAGRPFRCVLPWPSIFGVTSAASADGQVWPEDLPVEVAESEREAPTARPARLTAVESAAMRKPPADEEPKEDRPPRRHLRLVR